MGALEAGTQYLQQVLAKLPESQRPAAEAIFLDAQAQAALTELGAGVLRQQDYSRNLDAIALEKKAANDLYLQNKAWYDQNKADLDSLPQLLAETERLRALEGKPPATPPAAPPVPNPNAVSADDLQGIIRESLGLHAVIPTLIASHQVRFGEVLSEEQMIGLIQQAQQGQRSLKAQYAITFGEKLQAKSAEEEAAKVKKIQDEAIASYQRANPNMPYPVRPSGTSPLDFVKSPIDPASLTPEALAAEYNALVAGKA